MAVPDPPSKALNILHIDMDAFYASVEVLDDPRLAGLPVVVGGSPASRGVVCSATYEARAYGVRAAMPLAEARRRCPQAVFVPGRHARYAEIARALRAIFHRFTPRVEPLSLDEAFLDVGGCERLFGDGVAIGHRIQEVVRAELGLAASVGVSFNKFLAKLASDLRKPNGFVVIRAEEVHTVLDPLPVARLWGVGPRGEEVLARLGLRTIGDVRRVGAEFMTARLGPSGAQLHALSCGEDDRMVQTGGIPKSVGAERTFETDLVTLEDLERELLAIAEEVGGRLRAEGWCGKTLQLKVRFHDFRTITRRRTLDAGTDITGEIFAAARELLRGRTPVAGARIRLLGIQASQLIRPEQAQALLFEEQDRRRDRRLDRAVDSLRTRLGDDAVVRARSLAPRPEAEEPATRPRPRREKPRGR